MKAHLVALLVALMGTLSFSALAADDAAAKKDSATKTEPARTVKPHSHLDDKGLPHSDPDKSRMKSQKKDLRHEHQRDGK